MLRSKFLVKKSILRNTNNTGESAVERDTSISKSAFKFFMHSHLLGDSKHSLYFDYGSRIKVYSVHKRHEFMHAVDDGD